MEDYWVSQPCCAQWNECTRVIVHNMVAKPSSLPWHSLVTIGVSNATLTAGTPAACANPPDTRLSHRKERKNNDYYLMLSNDSISKMLKYEHFGLPWTYTCSTYAYCQHDLICRSTTVIGFFLVRCENTQTGVNKCFEILDSYPHAQAMILTDLWLPWIFFSWPNIVTTGHRLNSFSTMLNNSIRINWIILHILSVWLNDYFSGGR